MNNIYVACAERNASGLFTSQAPRAGKKQDVNLQVLFQTAWSYSDTNIPNTSTQSVLTQQKSKVTCSPAPLAGAIPSCLRKSGLVATSRHGH